MNNEIPSPILHYAPIEGTTLSEMRKAVRNNPLYQQGDCKLVWVNEGDLAHLIMLGRAKECQDTRTAEEKLKPKPEPITVGDTLLEAFKALRDTTSDALSALANLEIKSQHTGIDPKVLLDDLKKEHPNKNVIDGVQCAIEKGKISLNSDGMVVLTDDINTHGHESQTAYKLRVQAECSNAWRKNISN